MSNRASALPRKRNSDSLRAFLMLLPSLAAIAIFVYGFIGWTGYVSMSNWNSLVTDLSFAGLDNFRFLFRDFRFQSDLRNTVMFTVLFIIACLAIGLLLALLVNQRIRAEGLFRNIFIFPMAVSFVVTGVIWQWLLNPTSGVNLLLKNLGIEQVPKWYVSTQIVPSIKLGQIEFGLPVALIAVAVAAVWQMSGYTMAMILAGLRAIDEEIYEAARVDGASESRIFAVITLPLIRPVLLSAIIILGHISLKIFDLIYAMTGPGAMFVTDMPGVYMFETTFRGNHYGYGSAIAVLLLLFVSLLIVPYLISSRRGN
ncbi:carbohydrate ABC transporter permease [Cohnella massiliensis]|uniref:carbohydrate ABC transporter permease n=1 Tax=Cohnella massiliensis TaxID=1816691 RepID=UPI0009BC011D|nr:sugar ABC transporter permease [Cohnella massiliensis]